LLHAERRADFEHLSRVRSRAWARSPRALSHIPQVFRHVTRPTWFR